MNIERIKPALWPAHGGQAAALLARFGLPADHPLIDFSASINPLGLPDWLPERLTELAGGLVRYPQPDCRTAREAIAREHGVSPKQVLPTNGSAEAIFLTAAAHRDRRALVVQPTFSEYVRACRAYGLPVRDFMLEGPDFCREPAGLADAIEADTLLFVCRPNNPTATLMPRSAVERLLMHAAQRGARVVVDEAFVDLSLDPNESLVPLLRRFDNLILLRSLTKYFALPGLRLGYVLAAEPVVRELAALQPPWSVNHLAAELVAPLLADRSYQRRTRQWLESEQPRMQQALATAGLQVVPSRTAFFLAQPEAGAQATDECFERLLHNGILARHTHGFPGLDGGWLRFALRDSADNERLLSALCAAGRSP